jgi:hypothetical protein
MKKIFNRSEKSSKTYSLISSITITRKVGLIKINTTDPREIQESQTKSTVLYPRD